jgi:hypothetical protein
MTCYYYFAPLLIDWDTDHFYPARRDAIDGRLEEIAGKFLEIILFNI